MSSSVLSCLRLLPVSLCLIFFFALENESRMSSISVSDQGRWWCDSGWFGLVALIQSHASAQRVRNRLPSRRPIGPAHGISLLTSLLFAQDLLLTLSNISLLYAYSAPTTYSSNFRASISTTLIGLHYSTGILSCPTARGNARSHPRKVSPRLATESIYSPETLRYAPPSYFQAKT